MVAFKDPSADVDDAGLLSPFIALDAGLFIVDMAGMVKHRAQKIGFKQVPQLGR